MNDNQEIKITLKPRDDKNDGPFPKSVFPTNVFPRRIFPWMGGDNDDDDENINSITKKPEHIDKEDE